VRHVEQQGTVIGIIHILCQAHAFQCTTSDRFGTHDYSSTPGGLAADFVAKFFTASVIE